MADQSVATMAPQEKSTAHLEELMARAAGHLVEPMAHLEELEGQSEVPAFPQPLHLAFAAKEAE